MAAEGRDPAKVFLLPGIRPIVGRTVEEAERKYQELAALVPIENAIAALARPFKATTTFPIPAGQRLSPTWATWGATTSKAPATRSSSTPRPTA